MAYVSIVTESSDAKELTSHIAVAWFPLVRNAVLSSTQKASSFFCSWPYFLNPNILLNYKSIFSVVHVSHAMVFFNHNSFAYYLQLANSYINLINNLLFLKGTRFLRLSSHLVISFISFTFSIESHLWEKHQGKKGSGGQCNELHKSSLDFYVLNYLN